MTASAGPPDHPDYRAPVRLSRVMGVVGLTTFGIAYMVPLTVFSTLGPVSKITGNGVPGAYVITLVVMLFTALSNGRMVQKFPFAGSAYTYSQRSFGGHVGFMTGWALMLDYLLLPMINYLLLGLYLSEYVPAIPAAVWILGGIALVTILNVLGIKSVSSFTGIVVTVQVIFVVVFIILSIMSATDRGLPDVSTAFTGEHGAGALFTGAAILALSFLGFDAVTTLSEEARDPIRDVPRAILAVTLLGGAMFILISLTAYVVIPDWRDFQNVDTASVEVIRAAGGTWLTNLFVAGYIAGTLGSALASQASVSRILYTMGRERVMPRPLFGVLNKRFKSPARATLVVSAISLAALVTPLEFVISIISFGALAAFSMVNLSVIKSFAIDDARRNGADFVRYVTLPFVGFLMTVWLWSSLPSNALMVGMIWLPLGALYLLGLTRGFTRPPPIMDMTEVEQ